MRMVLEAAQFSHQNIIVSPKAAVSSSISSGNRERSVLHRFPRSTSLKSFENLQSQHLGKRHTLRRASSASFDGSSLNHIMLGIEPEVPVWPERERVQQEMMWDNIERRANALDFPLSLRMIKKKQQIMKEGISQLGLDSDSGLACTYSFQKAFSSMVSIVLELQGKALQMRETVTSEDLNLLIDGVQRELHRSFAWLFQQVFSRTPTFMTEVMILLSDFCLLSVENGLIPSVAEEEEETEVLKETTIPTPLPDQIPGNVAEEASLIQQKQEEVVLKDSVSPPRVELEPEHYYEYLRTDLAYQMHLFEDPHNTLLLCNYAQFLQLVAHDYDRAEECYKRAIQIDPSDAMGLTLYANFLWVVRKDLMGAEERYVEAVATEPENPYHSSIYANFLWNTGGKDTCFPLDTP
ncbi:uncharacterized protein LOC124927417 [Impatiens glandulifera]|uniref:uncharacterized protein LOC124927417 n=1 Tax=Impatiens glandulifera TaxID=253017 RepID=UPI001FB07F3C|nr:uncharacterized protein LOC124927417 [Impatiens glandulifera]